MFRQFQKVVCITYPTWIYEDGKYKGASAPGPSKDEIVTVVGFDSDDWNYLQLLEYPGDSYHKDGFRPLETTYTESEIESVDISEITQEEVITV
jgi:hypothetical protein